LDYEIMLEEQVARGAELSGAGMAAGRLS